MYVQRGQILPVSHHVAYVPIRRLEKGKELSGHVTLRALSRVPLFLHAASVGSFDDRFLVVVFVLSHKAWNMEKEELVAAVQNLTDSTNTLFDKLNVSYNNARLIHEVGLTLTKQRHIDGILQDVAQILKKRLDYDRGMILLADKEKTALTFGACFGYMDEQLSALRRVSFRLRPGSKGILAVCLRNGGPSSSTISKKSSMTSPATAWRSRRRWG